MDGEGNPAFCLAFIVVGDRFHHISHDDERLVAEHLSQEINVLGGVGCAEMLAVVQDGAAAPGIGFCQFALHDFRGFLIKGIALRHRLEIYLREGA